MKILICLLFLFSCAQIKEKFSKTAEYCKAHPLECKEKKNIHDQEVQYSKCRDLEWITGRDYQCGSK